MEVATPHLAGHVHIEQQISNTDSLYRAVFHFCCFVQRMWSASDALSTLPHYMCHYYGRNGGLADLLKFSHVPKHISVYIV